MSIKEQINNSENTVVNNRATPLWESPLCTTVLTLAVVIVLLSLSGLASAFTQHISFYFIIPALLAVSIFSKPFAKI